MPLRYCGVAKLARSKKSLHIELDLPGTVFTYHLFIRKKSLEKVLAGRQHGTKAVMPVNESRKNL